jgi:hypothetical protein
MEILLKRLWKDGDEEMEKVERREKKEKEGEEKWKTGKKLLDLRLGHDSSGRTPAKPTQGPEFKLQYLQREKTNIGSKTHVPKLSLQTKVFPQC